METIQWKTKCLHVDIETGEQLTEINLLNYTKLETKRETYIQNGHGNITLTTTYRRIYNNSLFDNDTI